MSTEFITVRDEYTGEEWPDGRHTIETLVTGDLAELIRAASGEEGPVKIKEYGVEGGWSEYTVEWDWDFVVTVDGKEVFSTETGWDGPARFHLPTEHNKYNGLGLLMEWLAKAVRDGSR